MMHIEVCEVYRMFFLLYEVGEENEHHTLVRKYASIFCVLLSDTEEKYLTFGQKRQRLPCEKCVYLKRLIHKRIDQLGRQGERTPTFFFFPFVVG
jgi:hypothetical protein